MNEPSQPSKEESGQKRSLSTAQNALLAEVLGDVLILSDEVKRLKDVLPGCAQEIENSGQKAAEIVNSQVIRSVGEIKAEAARLEAQQFAQAFKEETAKTLKSFHEHVTMAAPSRWKYRLAMGLLGQGLFCAIAGAAVTYFVLNGEIDQERKAGQQIIEAIPKLDAETKAKLLDTMQKSHKTQ